MQFWEGACQKRGEGSEMQYKWKRTLKMTAKASFNALDLKLSDPANIPGSILGPSTVILAKFPCMWKNFFFFFTELFRTAENASSQGEMEGTENQGK